MCQSVNVFAHVAASLRAHRFLARHADAELDGLVERTVPPCDISRVGVFRAVMTKHVEQAWTCFSLQ